MLFFLSGVLPDSELFSWFSYQLGYFSLRSADSDLEETDFLVAALVGFMYLGVILGVRCGLFMEASLKIKKKFSIYFV